MAIKADKDEIRQISAAPIQVAATRAPTGQYKPKQIPRNVATPLPPLKRSQTGKRWPNTAPSPAMASLPGRRWRARSTATVPFAPSHKSVAAAAHFLPVRSTLVAPILPEPILRTSPAPDTKVKNRPKGMEPSR